MTTIQLLETNTYLPSILKNVEMENGLVNKNNIKKTKRQLGTLEGKVTVKFADDFKITDEELIGKIRFERNNSRRIF